MTSSNNEAIAVIGMSLRFPQEATDADSFWQMLLAGRNASTEIPADRYNIDAFYHPDPARTDAVRVRKAHFMKGDIGQFDSAFFNMSSAEAACLDPQQRGLLEGAYHALENAGLKMSDVAKSNTSVYAASFSREYDAVIGRDPDVLSRYQATGLGSSLLANRVSHFFDLLGPSLSVDTACSSGLYALHLACQSLLLKESDMSIVSGANTYIGPDAMTLSLSNASFLSEDGRCFSFDARGNGYARGEGFATIILMPLEAAIRKGHPIRAVIRGTGTNQDGRTPSITQPSGSAQYKLIRDTYERAGLDFGLTGMVEAHGTGTLVGDPTEANAIGTAFKDSRDDGNPLFIGAAKANIGHLEGASGLAGLVKAILTLETGIIPPIADFKTLNPGIDAKELKLQFPTQATPWPREGLRRVSVNSFGYGGANAHAILDDAHHYLDQHGLAGLHFTAKALPSATSVSMLCERIGRDYTLQQSIEAGQTEIKHTNASTNGDKEPIITQKSHHRQHDVRQVNRVNGHATNGKQHDVSDTSHSQTTGVQLNGVQSNGVQSNGVQSNGVQSNGVQSNGVQSNGVQSNGVQSNGVQSNGVQSNGVQSNGIKSNGVQSNGVHINGSASDNAEKIKIIDSQKDQIDKANSNTEKPHARTVDSLEHPAILVFSSSDEHGTTRQVSKVQQYLSSLPVERLSASLVRDMAYTLSQKRNQFRWRSFAVSHEVETLSSTLATTVSKPERYTLEPEVQFVFSGQGAQLIGMGMKLLCYEPFRQSIDACDHYLKSLGSQWSIIDEIQKPKESSRLASPALSQPLCTALQIALVDLLGSWGIAPGAVCGHSSGEIAAAYAAGMLSREYAWKVAYFRGVVSANLVEESSQTPTTMLSVGLNEEEAKEFLAKEAPADDVGIACINSPVNVTLSGSRSTIDKLAKLLDKAEKFVRRLDIDIAYHSKLMYRVSETYARLIGDDSAILEQNPKSVRMYSSVTGAETEQQVVKEASYWVSNLVSTVKFSSAFTAMASSIKFDRSKGNTSKILPVFVEIGPQAALRRPVQNCSEELFGNDKWCYFSALQAKIESDHALLGLLGHLWTRGVAFDLETINQHAVPGHAPRLLVDLPSYSFNYDKVNWLESRRSRMYRHKTHRRHQLLGARAMDWNETEACWRHLIRVQENKWILDHTLNGSPVYPGSGMLVMAIEAIRQLSDVPDQITGYHLKNVRFLRAINVNDAEAGTEAEIRLRPRREATKPAYSWHDWRIFAMDQDNWVEVAYGSVKCSYSFEENAGSEARDAQQNQRQRQAYHDTLYDCSYSVNTPQFYDNIARMGFHYGPTFRHLSDIVYNKKGRAAAALPLRAWAQNNAYAAWDPCVIHPTTLDTLCHLAAVQISHGGWKSTPTMMFTHVGDFWVSDKLLHASDDAVLQAFATETLKGLRENEHSIVGFLGDDDQVVVLGERIRGTSITRDLATTDLGTDHMCYGLLSLPDYTLLSTSQRQEYYDNRFVGIEPPNLQTIDIADALSMHYIKETLKLVDGRPGQDLNSHGKKYVSWMRKALQLFNPTTSRMVSDQALQDTMSMEEHTDPVFALVNTVGRKVQDVLYNNVNPVQIMFEGDLTRNFYHCQLFQGGVKKTAEVLNLMAHHNPELHILEVGAGTGVTASAVFDELATTVSPDIDLIKFGKYTYTDISSGFFERARQSYTKVEQCLDFRRLDIETDPLTQGFENAQVDVLLIMNVLHATKDQRKALKHCHQLLKPGGTILISEYCNPDTVLDNFLFGLLPGWWLATEPERQETPLLTEKQWDALLKECGFSGIELKFRDHENIPHHRITIFTSTSVPLPQEQDAVQIQSLPIPAQFWVLHDAESKLQTEMADRIGDSLRAKGAEVQFYSLATLPIDQVSGRLVISLLETSTNIWQNVSDKDWTILQKVVLNCKRIFWVTAGSEDTAVKAKTEIATGLSRTLCTERGYSFFFVLHLSSRNEHAHNTSHILNVIDHVSEDKVWQETEFREVNGLLQIQRVSPLPHLNRSIAQRVSQHRLQDYTISSANPKDITLTIASPGLLETLYFRENQNSFAELKSDEVEIKVAYATLNFKDLMIALGQAVGSGFGFDGSGIVTRSVDADIKVGDRVAFYAAEGAYSTYARVPARQVHRIPDTMDLQFAAALSIAYLTALYCLKYLGRVEKGDKVLIHSAAGGVGQAAVMLCQFWEAEVFVTTGSESKRQLLMDEYNIPSDHIFSSRDPTFAKDIHLATNGRGVDVILNSLSGDLLSKSWECIAPMGRFIEMGKRDIIVNNALAMGPFGRNTTFAAVDLSVIMVEDPVLSRKVYTELFDLLQKFPNKLSAPKPIQVHDISEIESVMRHLQTGKSTGRILLEFREGSTVKYKPAVKPAYSFHSDATYVYGGGLGESTRNIVRWMASRGARNFLLLSRSGSENNPVARKFIKEMEASGCRIWAPSCDLTDSNLVAKVVQQATSEMPPIRGCIQGAMVLHDITFERMSRQMFHKALAPKTLGSWNLHEVLPQGLDFFVMLSSYTGIIGNYSQSNYAAGNCYEDALAAHRLQQGERAVSLDLPMLLEVGWAAENYGLIQNLERSGFSALTQEQMMAVLDLVCDPEFDYSNKMHAQVLPNPESPQALYRNTYELPVPWMPKPIMAYMKRIGTTFGHGGVKENKEETVDYLELIKSASTADEAAELLANGMVEKLARSLAVAAVELDINKAPSELGVDSLIAVEIRYWVMKEIRVEVAVFNILKDQSLFDLCLSLVTQARGR